MMTLREGWIWCLTGVAKTPLFGGDPGLGHLCHAVRRPQLIRHSSMGAGPRGCCWGSARRRATLHRVFKGLDVAA